MRLTDDYLIISENPFFVEETIKVLLKMAKKNNFKFNSAKFKSNFKLFKDQKEIHTETIQWIGKTINLQTMELEHLQVTKKKEAFFTVDLCFLLIFYQYSLYVG